MGIKKTCFKYGWNENEQEFLIKSYGSSFFKKYNEWIMKTSKERGLYKNYFREARESFCQDKKK